MNPSGFINIISGIVLLLLLIACGKHEPVLLEKLDPADTGIDFINRVISSDSLNIQNYPLMFNGGGVALGDINNDGLADLYLTGNMVSSRLYLNKGNMKFEDITKSAGVETKGWASGVSMVDINADGYLDIYVSRVSPQYWNPDNRANLLFINNGDCTFSEQAAEYNLDFKGFTVQSAFLDYDRDGDLDVYLLNHSPGSFSRSQDLRAPQMLLGQTYQSYDELYRNDGNGVFSRVTEQAGLSREVGFGLGVAVSDINRDSWPDIYVSNDIIPDDVLYINNGDGTFTDKIDDYTKHTSFAGMGIDIADFNNDGWPDISQVDMMPESHEDRKQMTGGTSYQRQREMINSGLHYQYSINTLQLNNGLTGKGEINFSEISRFAGVAYTDWSWSTLFGDYNNDGLKDLMITNGFPKAINNYDYLTNLYKVQQFGTEEYRKEKMLKILQNLKSIKVPNYLFRNEGDLTFSDQSHHWGFQDPGYSYGASHGDLDNDGDLDIVINNVNQSASVYQNNSDIFSDHNYLSIVLEGNSGNRNGIGSEIILVYDNERQFKYVSPYRGYQSSMDHKIHFGLEDQTRVDSLTVTWPDGRRQFLTDVQANQEIILNIQDADVSEKDSPSDAEPTDKSFSDITPRMNLQYRHKENTDNDYSIQGFLPYQLSLTGPPITTADVNSDGREDLFIGGAAGQPGTLLLQSEEGKFEKTEEKEPWTSDREYEDSGASFFDADGDGDSDLYIASGGYEFSPVSNMLQDRLYINIGNGNFIQNEAALPKMLTSSSCIKPADYDGDGDIDLFVGGRMVPRKYPYPAKSYLLQNDNGIFTDVTAEAAPQLLKAGMITDAEWSDFNQDGQVDLVTAGEWLPVQFHSNNGGTFSEVSDPCKTSSMRGWWYSLAQGDFDHDGDPDFIAGNLGLNYSYSTNDKQKFEVFASDFDVNQRVDILFSLDKQNTHIPYYGKAKFGQHIPSINGHYKTYKGFSEATVNEILGQSSMGNALHLQVDTFASVYIENRGSKGFKIFKLPNRAQFSSINAIATTDINQDGNLDAILAGNIYNTEPQTARNDASNGLVLIGNGDGEFEETSPIKSGLMTPNQVSDLKLLNLGDRKILLVANTNKYLKVFKFNNQ